MAESIDLRNNAILARHLTNHIVNVCGPCVQSGPFAGMQLALESSWSDDLPARLLGTYESELHDFILRGRFARYEQVVDVGCADGYYAVGLALLYPAATIYAYDINPGARAITQRNAMINNVGDRVVVRGACEQSTLAEHARTNVRTLVICDCEGFELELFRSRSTVEALANSDLIIETHQFADPHCTMKVNSYFESSHDIEIVGVGPRDPNKFAVLRNLGEDDRWRGVSEYRPYSMEWLICRGKQ